MSRPAVLFDLDNTLTPRRSCVVSFANVLAEDFGLHVVDAADPDSLRLLGSVANGGSRLETLSAGDSLVVVSAAWDGFFLYSLADDPLIPALRSQTVVDVGGGGDERQRHTRHTRRTGRLESSHRGGHVDRRRRHVDDLNVRRRRRRVARSIGGREHDRVGPQRKEVREIDGDGDGFAFGGVLWRPGYILYNQVGNGSGQV